MRMSIDPAKDYADPGLFAGPDQPLIEGRERRMLSDRQLEVGRTVRAHIVEPGQLEEPFGVFLSEADVGIDSSEWHDLLLEMLE